MTQTSEKHEEKRQSEYNFTYEGGKLAGRIGGATITVLNDSLNGEETAAATYVKFDFLGKNIELRNDAFYALCDFIEDLKGELCRIEKQTQKQGR